jgi:hypothetical protein
VKQLLTNAGPDTEWEVFRQHKNVSDWADFENNNLKRENSLFLDARERVSLLSGSAELRRGDWRTLRDGGPTRKMNCVTPSEKRRNECKLRGRQQLENKKHLRN